MNMTSMPPCRFFPERTINIAAGEQHGQQPDIYYVDIRKLARKEFAFRFSWSSLSEVAWIVPSMVSCVPHTQEDLRLAVQHLSRPPSSSSQPSSESINRTASRSLTADECVSVDGLFADNCLAGDSTDQVNDAPTGTSCNSQDDDDDVVCLTQFLIEEIKSSNTDFHEQIRSAYRTNTTLMQEFIRTTSIPLHQRPAKYAVLVWFLNPANAIFFVPARHTTERAASYENLFPMFWTHQYSVIPGLIQCQASIPTGPTSRKNSTTKYSMIKKVLVSAVLRVLMPIMSWPRDRIPTYATDFGGWMSGSGNNWADAFVKAFPAKVKQMNSLDNTAEVFGKGLPKTITRQCAYLKDYLFGCKLSEAANRMCNDMRKLDPSLDVSVTSKKNSTPLNIRPRLIAD